jgi:hypothetical protein
VAEVPPSLTGMGIPFLRETHYNRSSIKVAAEGLPLRRRRNILRRIVKRQLRIRRRLSMSRPLNLTSSSSPRKGRNLRCTGCTAQYPRIRSAAQGTKNTCCSIAGILTLRSLLWRSPCTTFEGRAEICTFMGSRHGV